MRAIVLWMLLFSAGPLVRAQTFGSVGGVVLDDVTGSPVNKVVVLLASGQFSALPYASVTDREGKFSLPEIAPGNYTLKLERAGYLSLPFGFAVKVIAGETLTGITLKITKQGIIAGRVMLPGQNQVQLWRKSPSPGAGAIAPLNPILAAADGTFVIGDLATGRYILRTLPESRANMIVLEVSAGKETRDVHVERRSGATYRISGIARNPAPGRMPNVRVYLDREDPSVGWVALLGSHQPADRGLRLCVSSCWRISNCRRNLRTKRVLLSKLLCPESSPRGRAKRHWDIAGVHSNGGDHWDCIRGAKPAGTVATASGMAGRGQRGDHHTCFGPGVAEGNLPATSDPWPVSNSRWQPV